MEAYQFDLASEELIGKDDAAGRIGRLQGKGRPLHTCAVRRLWRTGARGIPLPSLIVGGRRVTSAGAIAWWIAAVNAADSGRRTGATSPNATAPLTATEREALAAVGIEA